MDEKVAAIGPRGRQLRRLRSDASWSDPAKREVFLAHLAMTCNVRDASAKAKLKSNHGYVLRRRDPEFRARWDAAIDEGRERLWGMLLAQAMRELEPVPVLEGEGETPLPDPTLALSLIKLHAAGVVRTNGRKAEWRAPMTADALRVLVFEKLQDKRRELTRDV